MSAFTSESGHANLRIVVPKRRFEIRPRSMPTIETARRDGALRAAIASAGRDGGTTCLLSLTRHIGFLQLDDGVTQRFHPV